MTADTRERSILFFDIDGTIITEDGTHTIPESTRTALRMAKERGHLIYINTGRVFLNVEPMIRNLGFDGYVCGCGTNIIYREQELLHHEIPVELQRRTVDHITHCKMNVIYEASDLNALSTSYPMNPALKELVEYFTGDGRLLVSVTDPAFHFDKFTGWYRTEDQELHEEFCRFAEDYYDYIDRGVTDGWGMCELVPRGYSKGTGIHYLLDHHRVDLAHCYVFGDSTNDLPMFQAVTHSVAMGGSPKIVTDSVEYVTDSILEDGLYRAMEHYHLI